MGKSFNKNINTTLNLFDSMIKPILTYASDFWGCLKLPKNNPIETLQLILEVRKQTPNLGVFLVELGRTNIEIDCIRLSINNWEQIRNKKPTNY